MSSPPPTKPPRGVKQGKETSGLLMSVIRTLSASETNEQREKERAKLEKEYKKSDARLDELVAAHAQDITDVMQKFSLVSSSLSAWGQHCSAAEARLGACRALLRVRRDDLRRLWADARTHHHALRMLTDIERVVVCSREARERASAGRAVGAAHALRAALQTARTELPAVSALGATTDNLEAARRELTEAMVRRLSEAVYGAEGAGRGRRGAGVGGGGSARRRTALLLAELTKSEEVTDAYLQDITPEFEASLAEEDKTFETTVMISLEALGVLEQLKEATEKFKVQIQNELLEVIDSVSRRIIDDVDIDEGEEESEIQDTEGVSETGRPLARLVNCLTEEFKACGNRNKRLLQLWRAALQKHKISEQSLHTEQHYWSAVQQVMQLLLTEYLEIESVTLSRSRAPDAVPDLRLADYFSKKKPQRRRDKLFKLTTSLPSPAPRARRQRYPLVCAPRPELLHDALPALHALCALLERPGGGECSLRMFVSDYVRWGESERLAREARCGVERAARAPGAWRERTAGGGRDTERPVFSCAVEAWGWLARAGEAARRCGPCGGAGAAKAAAGAATALGALARAAHARLAPGPPSRAARWLADDDIVRFLRALPNYVAAVRGAECSEKELKQAYEREAEILGSSLGDGEVSSREVTQRIDALVELALMSESMDWLCRKTKTLPSIICAPLPASPGLKLSEKVIDEIEAAIAVFEDIAQKCLLFLHLEVRIECFHYLGQEERGAGSTGGGGVAAAEAEGSAGEAGGAASLAHRLLAFHEQAAAVLAPPAMAYIMNGIGEMMSAAVVWRWQSEAGGAGSGTGGGAAGARLAALRHCLAALSLPHDGLHAAHAYMHLLACTPEEIITSVREKGPQFSELEYLNAFKVLGARRGLGAAAMRAHLAQLAAAMGHVGVTV